MNSHEHIPVHLKQNIFMMNSIDKYYEKYSCYISGVDIKFIYLIELKHSLQFLKNSIKIKLIISNNQMNWSDDSLFFFNSQYIFSLTQ